MPYRRKMQEIYISPNILDDDANTPDILKWIKHFIAMTVLIL